MNSDFFKMLPTNYSLTNHIYLKYICINMIWNKTIYKG